MIGQEATDQRLDERRRRVGLNLALFLVLVIVALAGREVVAIGFNHGGGDFGYALGDIAYALAVPGSVALVLLVPGLLLLGSTDRRLPTGVRRALAFPVAALAFAPFVSVTAGGAEILPFAGGAIAYAALMRLPSEAVTATTR
jgi:hypothetical protein